MQGHNVLGDQLRKYRVQAGLTQEQLAQLVDCSDRLIRRAEAGYSIRLDTLRKIADVITESGIPVEPTDLIGSNLAVARRFWKAYDRHRQRMPDHFPYFAEGVSWMEPGSKGDLPFVGHWQGIEGVREYLTQFFVIFRRDSLDTQPLFLQNVQHVSFKHNDRWSCVGNLRRKAPVWINWHLTFRDGLIVRVEHQFDTLAAHRLAVRCRCREPC